MEKHIWTSQKYFGKKYCGKMRLRVIWSEQQEVCMAKKNTLNSMRRTYCLLWNLVEGPSCYGAAWLAQVMETLLKLRATWIPLSISRFLTIMLKSRSQGWSYAGVGFFMILSTVQNPLRNSCRSTSTIFWNGHPSPKTLTSLKMYGLIWSRLSPHGSKETWLNWRCFVCRNGPK